MTAHAARPRIGRAVAIGLAAAISVALAAAAGGMRPSLAQEPTHAVLQIHLLDPGGTGTTVRTDSYSLLDPAGGSIGDWAGRWWVKGRFIAGAFDPLVVVAYETISATGTGHQSRFALLTFDGTRFVIRQLEDVGPANSEIHHVSIFPLGLLLKMHIYEGTDPTVPMVVHGYTWDGDSFEVDIAPPPPALPPVPPDAAQDVPLPGEMLVGVAPIYPFAITTNATVPGGSRLPFLAVPSPEILAVEADPKGGTYVATVPVVLTANSPAATIHYTLDGSDPNEASPIFAGPRPIYILPFDPVSGAPRPSVTLKFMATEPLKAPSAVVSESYRVTQGELVDTDGDGLIDLWEVTECVTNCRPDDGAGGCPAPPLADHCFDPLVPDADFDCDRDGWSDFDEKRLGSDPSCGSSLPAVNADRRRVKFSGTASRPAGVETTPGSSVETISPRGTDLLVHAVAPVTDPVTGPAGVFTDAPTRGEADAVLRIVDLDAPQVVLQRFVPFLAWEASLPARTFADDQIDGAADWYDEYTQALRYDIGLAGLSIDSTSSAMLQVLERTVESRLPGLAIDYTGIPIEDRDLPPLGNFPAAADGDVDLDGDGALDPLALAFGESGAGMTGQQTKYLLLGGTDIGLLGQAILDAARNPDDPTYSEWVSFAADVFRAVPDVADFHGTTDEVLTRILDDPDDLDPLLADHIAGLPAGAPAIAWAGPAAAGALPGTDVPAPEVLPADLTGLVAEVLQAVSTTDAIFARVVARGEREWYRRGDSFASGEVYRGIVTDLVGKQAGDPAGLAEIEAGAEQAAEAVAQARLLAGSGRSGAVLNLRAGIGILAAALDSAGGDPTALAALTGRLAEIVYRIDRLAGDAVALAALEVRAGAGDFLLPDVVPPLVVASPGTPIFTGILSVSLIADEPAAIFYTIDGSDPVPGGTATFQGMNEVAGIVITADTTLSWFGLDVPALNQGGIVRITYRRDSDADGFADAADNCPLVANAGQQDFDGDLLGDACDPNDDNDPLDDFADCRPLDPGLWSSPGESPITLSFLDQATISWTSLASAAGPATLYDLARGPLSDLHGGQPAGSEFAGATCLRNDFVNPPLATADTDLPARGQGFYYLVRGDNACGMGSYGRRSDGIERVILACP